jgi:hypothetical protein
MAETIIVLLIVVAAAVFAGRKLYRSVAGAETPCACEPTPPAHGGCSQCPSAGEACTPACDTDSGATQQPGAAAHDSR